MRKSLRNILIVTAMMLCTTLWVSATPEYTVLDGMITKYNANADIVTIPAVIDGVEIAGIDPNAFLNKDMHTVIIEEGIEVIRPKAFVGCKNLQYVKSPESMLLINEKAFFDCNPNLELDVDAKTHVMGEAAAVTLLETEEGTTGDSTTGGSTTGGTTSGGSTTIEFLYSGNTITGCLGEEAEIVIPESVDGVTITAIGDSAFEGNTVITSVVIPDTVTSIGARAFKGCTALVQLTLSKNLSSAGKETFSECSALKSVTIPGSLKRIPEKMFYICPALTEVVFEEGVERTGTYAFCECPALKTVSVPSTITHIGVWSFGNCLALEGFDMPEGLVTVGSAGFYRCQKITEIIMPDTVTTMETHAFRGCSKLTNLKLSENINRIGYRALNGCGFTGIEIPKNVIYIDDESFYQCQKLVSIEIPDGIISIGNKAFYGCFRMTECIIYGEDVTFGTDVFFSVAEGCKIWAPEGSATALSAEEKGISYSVIKDKASVLEENVYLNGEAVTADTVIKNGDKLSVNYKIMKSDDNDNEMLLALLKFDEDGNFLGFAPIYVSVDGNSQGAIEGSFDITDEYQVKIVLFNSIQDFKALCGAKEFKCE